MKIRESTESELVETLNIHVEAFGEEKGAIIAKLVDDMLHDETGEPKLSLIAEADCRLVGHVLFTKAVIIDQPHVSASILAPLAVRPDAQKSGVGQKLINTGLCQLRAAGTDLVFVLGHPDYYPRCGFAPACKQGLEAPYPIPEEHSDAWMVQALSCDVLGRVHGKIKCCQALDEPQHWRE